MNILVTGGTGFLGRHLVWRFCREGAHVVFTGRNKAQAQEILHQVDAMRENADEGSTPVGHATFMEFHHGAPGAQDALDRAAHGMDAIVHNAAFTAPWGRSEEFISANVTSTEEVIHACKAHEVPRMVHLSTPSLYFDYHDSLDIHESDPLPEPVSHYAITKATAERMVQEAGLPEAVILRPRAIYGPWDNALLPRLIRAMQTGPLPMMRGGRALLDLTYIDNVVDAVVLAVRRPFELMTRSVGCTTPVYNISNGEPISVRELYHTISEEFGLRLKTLELPYVVADMLARLAELAANTLSHREPRLTRYTLGVLSFSQTLNLDRARAELGYSPKVSLREGIRATARWWKAAQSRALARAEKDGSSSSEQQDGAAAVHVVLQSAREAVRVRA
ncbi:MAG: NAD-dependent epimerase/dehydratase family protein [Candidatus Methylacidiphilales bacterium]